MVLSHFEIVAPGASPTRTACVLHGILGSGANWRTMVRRLAATPEGRDWRFIVPDLRGHGDSPGSTFGPPLAGPHTVHAAARDLVALEASLGHTFAWVLGHSFGGKVACAFAEQRPATVESLWLLDTNPLPVPIETRTADDSVALVFDALAAMGDDLPERDAVIERLIALGVGRATAMWLGTAVRRRDDGGHAWRFSLPVLRALIADYARLDCFAPLVREGRPQRAQHLVRGGRSDRFDAASLAALGAQDALVISVLETAGHWLHVDDPDGLLALFQAEAARLQR